MCRTDHPSRCARHVLGAICALLMLGVPNAVAGDPVSAFLQRHELTDVLARHLEQRIEQADDEEREALLLQLAGIYTTLLEDETDLARRMQLEERSRRLLDLAPRDSADELRLALVRNTYRSAERVAEDDRLRLADESDVDQARKQFAEIVPQLNSLTQQLERSTTLLTRRLSRAGRAELATLEDRLTRQRRTLMQSRYMHAWSLYYKAYLSEDRRHAEQHARQAQRLFAELLMTESAHPRPEEVSIDLRGIEPLARSIVGMALCQSMTSSWATAIGWIDLLSHQDTAPEVRPLRDGWRVLIYLEHEQYQQAHQVLSRAIEQSKEPIPVSWLRLAAIGAMEPDGAPGDAHQLARFAMTQLASRGELQQVLDLAERYGTDALGDSGFAMRYIEGLVTYRQARDQHDHDAPATDAELIEQYHAARDAFEQALREDDLEAYAEATDAVHMLIAWSLYYAGDLPAAAERFERVASTEGMDEARVEEALWMAIVTLDRLLADEDDPSARQKQAELTERFLAAYPGSNHAPTLLVNRSLQQTEMTDEDIERLLSIPPGHSASDSGRRRALLALYQNFRRSGERQRSDHAYRFLSIAVSMLDQPDSFGASNDPQRTARMVTVIRQTLEVALHPRISRSNDARIAIEAFDALDDSDEHIRQYVDEIRFRGVQLALLDGDLSEAQQRADAIWQQDRRSRWSRLAARVVFQHAHRLWQASAEDSAEYDAAKEAVILFGGRVLREFEDDDDPLDGDGAPIVARAVADASMIAWQRHGNEERGRIALFLSERLLERQPNHRGLLRNVAILSGSFDRAEQSLTAWRRLVAGSELGSEEWFEARYHQIRLLVEHDFSRAMRLMQQHRQFYPNFGPEPWDAKFRILAEELDSLAQQSSDTTP